MRSTYNSSLLRSPSPPPAALLRPAQEEDDEEPSLPLPEAVDQVKFSFELVPSGTCWYQTFLRDEAQAGQPLPDAALSSGPAPFLLPYEMSLETILKSGRPDRKKAKKKAKTTGDAADETVTRRGSSRRKAAATAACDADFRPIISTRLQMQSAARLAAAEAASASRSSGRTAEQSGQKKKTAAAAAPPSSRTAKLWHLPRKSPRCHASTLAILSSAKTSEDEGSNHPGEEEEEAAAPPVTKEAPPADPEWARTLQEMLTHGLRQRRILRPDQIKKKRGRPRKYPLPDDESTAPPADHQVVVEEVVVADGPLSDLLATPLHRIGDIVDERIRADDDDTIAFEDSSDDCSWIDGLKPTTDVDAERRSTAAAAAAAALRLNDNDPFSDQDVFHDLDSQSTGESGGGASGSSSVYETASEVGSSQEGSTGSGGGGRSSKWRRRKRPNMTGWPRSTKKRRPLAHLSIDPEDDDDDGPPVLSPIREESVVGNASSNSAGHNASDSRSVMKIFLRPDLFVLNKCFSFYFCRLSFVSKPFQFQRKTLRFVGKRILRPAAHRNAPQRLEYWPCFDSSSAGTASAAAQSSARSSSRQRKQRSSGRKAKA